VVVAEVCADGVLVDARANRVFDSADLALLVREWMGAHHVDTIFASSGGDVFSIARDERVVARESRPRTREPTRGRLDANAVGLDAR
jgi:hypothetical protein